MSMFTKRILAIVLSIVMLTGMLPVGALAAEGEGTQQASQETILTEPGEGVSEGTEEGNLTDDIGIDSDEDDTATDEGEYGIALTEEEIEAYADA